VTGETQDQRGTLRDALAQAARMLTARPDLAEEQAREILKAVPDQPHALLMLGAARRLQGDAVQARAILEPLAQTQLNAPDVQYELGMALGALGENRKAITALSRAAALNAKHPQAWRALGDEKTLAGDAKGADAAYARHIQASVNDPKLMQAAAALVANDLPVAEHSLRAFLKEHPTDISALRMLAEVGARLRRYEDAETLLVRALELAPGFAAARQNYASILYRHNKPQEVVEQVDILLKADPRNPNYRALRAAALGQLGEYAQASATYEKLLKEFPHHPSAWMSYGHTLKTQGRAQDGIDAYRRSIDQQPSLGEAYWSLANLKTFRFSPADIEAMRTQLARSDLPSEDRFHFEFALAKALEDENRFEEAFAHYEKGNALRRESAPYDPDETAEQVRRAKSLFTPDFIAARAYAGHPAPDPIFVVGLPRAGSTLIEQILSSHSQVEGTMELQDVGQMVRTIGGAGKKSRASAYPDVLADFPPEKLRALGEEYLTRTRTHRKTNKPFFIDKMPNNFLHAGFIRLILPNAKIIDARRHPLGCCLSCFKQHFARGQTFAYNLPDLGHYYARYVELMAHYDAVMPSHVHRVFYENMVADPETEVRKLLDYCGLPFEDTCLRFYENDRAVRTASSEQVRQPIFTDAKDHWQNFEPWLDPLKAALGPVLRDYPAAPVF
jgi:predicted Zn-dependent protease